MTQEYNKYKARLVAKGFYQRWGDDYIETFSALIKPVTAKTVLILALSKSWQLHQLDVNNDFLHGIWEEEEMYMSQPLSFESANKTLVCKINKALYGLKQVHRPWFDRFKGTLSVISSLCLFSSL